MLKRILLMIIAATFTLAASDLSGHWNGIIVTNNRPEIISLHLHQQDQTVSGTATFNVKEPLSEFDRIFAVRSRTRNISANIENPELIGNVLVFDLPDTPDRSIRFRLTSVNGPLTGTILHNGEALTGTAQFSDGIAQVILPAHSREGATNPVLVSSAEPSSSEEAIKAKLEGTVYLCVLIDLSGEPSEIYLLHQLGMGLDQKAIEAVKKWRFQPALLNGEPIPFETIVELTFRTL